MRQSLKKHDAPLILISHQEVLLFMADINMTLLIWFFHDFVLRVY